MQIRPVGAELFHEDRQTDERSDRRGKTNSCFVRTRLKTGEEREKNKRSFENFKYPGC